MITEAIILAGGLGTRLRSAVPDVPKCMAPVAGRPFIDFVLQYLSSQQINRFVLALGYQSAIVQQYIQQHFSGWDISFSIEEEPLGTGGAIAKAAKLVNGKYSVITNGDTLYKAAVQTAVPALHSNQAECLLFLKPMQDVERYGVVEMDEHQQVKAFREKQFYAEGLINGGLYVLDVPCFLQRQWPPAFSFEKDYFEANVLQTTFCGIEDDGYFIDIGMPADYEKAGRDLRFVQQGYVP